MFIVTSNNSLRVCLYIYDVCVLRVIAMSYVQRGDWNKLETRHRHCGGVEHRVRKPDWSKIASTANRLHIVVYSVASRNTFPKISA